MNKAFGDYECAGCASFAHDVSFTHDAIMDLAVPVALLPRTFDLCAYSYHELAYLHGLDTPHYPVPAIKEYVRMDTVSGYVMIFTAFSCLYCNDDGTNETYT